MAKIDKNGMVRGLVGNLVFRVVNGEGVMQSRPRRRKPSGGTLNENKQFADGLELSGALYVQLKEFGWNRCYSYLYGKLAAYMKRFLHGDLSQATQGEYLAMDKNDALQKLFKETLPRASKEGNVVTVHVPTVKPFNKNPHLANSDYLSYEVVLMGFGGDSLTMSDIDNRYRFETEIFDRRNGYKEEVVQWDLKQLAEPDVKLLIVAMRVKLLEYPNSAAFSNSKEANPVGILGVWNF